MKKILFLFVFSFTGHFVFCQVMDFKKLEADLVSDFETFKNASYEDRYKVYSPKFRTQLKRVLSHSKSFEYTFDLLSKYIKIINSPDDKVRLFSWDELGGGSWHDMTVLVQYKTNKNEIKTQYIDSDGFDETIRYTNAIQHSLFAIEIDNQSYYLALGWGTYGGGQHHEDILIFSIQDGVFKDCTSCISEPYSEISAPRGFKIDVKYDPKEQIISFNNPSENNKTYLKLVDAMFKEVKH